MTRKKKLEDLVNSYMFTEAGKKAEAFEAGIKKEEDEQRKKVESGLILLEKDTANDSDKPVPVPVPVPVLYQESTSTSTSTSTSIFPVTVPPFNQDSTSTSTSILPVPVPVPVSDKNEEDKLSENIELAPIQTHVYNYLLSKGLNGIFNKMRMSKDTGISYDTIRKTIKKLQSVGLLHIDFYNKHSKQISYRISNVKTVVVDGNSTSTSTSTSISPVPVPVPVPGKNTGTLISSSSSFLYLKTTTAKFFEHPESEFWKEHRVTSEMFERNIQEHGFDPEVLIMSAKHYAFEYSQPGKTPPEKSHLIHLIGGIRKFGLWTKPNGYVSYEDAEKRRLRAFIAEKRKELEELEALKLEASFFMFYEAYVKTPDSEEVKAVMEQASSFDLDNLRKKPDKKEAWLRTIWNKSRNMN